MYTAFFHEKCILYIQIETKNKHRTLLFIAYIEVTFLNLQHKIQLTDTSLISFKTENLLKAIGKFFGKFFRPEQAGIKL